MTYYKNYMDRQTVGEELHQRLLKLTPPAAQRNFRGLRLAAAACAALLVALGVWKFLPDGEVPKPVVVTENPGVVQSARPDVQEQPTVTEAPVPTDRVELTMPGAFPVHSSSEGELEFFAIPYVYYPDLSDAPQIDLAGARAMGAYSVTLDEDAVCTILWGSEERWERVRADERADNVPWPLFWGGFSLRGSAVYDQTGSLLETILQGADPDRQTFEICLTPWAVSVAEYEARGAARGDWAGTEYAAWRCRSDGGAGTDVEYNFVLRSGDVGVRARFAAPEAVIGKELCPGENLGTLFLRWCCSMDTELTLDHLLTDENVPEFRQTLFKNYEAALAEAEFAPYLPKQEPRGFALLDGGLVYQEGRMHRLWLNWGKAPSYDSLQISVEFPERGDTYGREPVDIKTPAAYDVRLYEIPWSESVPEAYRDSLYLPTFRAENMTRAVLETRETAADTGGSRWNFRVLHESGALVQYSCSGLDMDELWAIVESTLQ